MCVFITGGARFFGSNLAKDYLENGDEAYIIDNPLESMRTNIIRTDNVLK